MGNTTHNYQTVKTYGVQSAMSNNIIKIPVIINSPQSNDKYKCSFIVEAIYDKKETIKNIIDAIKSQINDTYSRKFKIIWIYSDNSFLNASTSEEHIDSNESITNYDQKEIIKKGLCIDIEPLQFEHKVSSNNITCQYMINSKSSNPWKCPIYFKMKKQYEFNEENLEHLDEFIHFKDEYAEIDECKFKDECKAFKRLESGGNTISDLCHVKLYRHPPRSRTIKLQENINSLIINKIQRQNYNIYEPTEIDKEIYEWNEKDGFLKALIDEVIENKFKNDLCLDDDDEKYNNYTILKIVDKKMNSVRHKAMGSPLNRAQMLSLILYTGCDCNYDLCKSQRNGDYEKWKWLDCCLYYAICLLSANEIGSFQVFSGLNKVKLDKASVDGGFFVTFVSTSWEKKVAEEFVDGDGMIIQFDASFKDHNRVQCCDVSWISKFPHECEVLFARSTPDWTDKGFSCIVLDDHNGVQTISLSRKTENEKLTMEYWQTVSNTINISSNKLTITKKSGPSNTWNNAYCKQSVGNDIDTEIVNENDTEIIDDNIIYTATWRIKINYMESTETSSIGIGIISDRNRSLEPNQDLDYTWFNNGDLSQMNKKNKGGPPFYQDDIITLILDLKQGTFNYQIESSEDKEKCVKRGVLFENISRYKQFYLAASLFLPNSSISLMQF